MTKAMQRLEILLKRMPDHGNLIRELVAQHTDEVIGDNEATEEIAEASEWEYALERNILRKEQRKKAGL